jgi:hypothetical protein
LDITSNHYADNIETDAVHDRAYIAVSAIANTQRISAKAQLSGPHEQQVEKVMPLQRTPPSPVKPNLGAPQTVIPPRTPAQAAAPDHGVSTLPKPQVNGPKFVVPNGTANTPPAAGGTVMTAPEKATPSVGASKPLQTFTPHGPNASVVTMSRLHSLPAIGVSRASIRGQDYSVWRHGCHAHYHDRWYNCVALSALPAILIAANEFYPFAYIDAPESYCNGLTEDGCQLVWQDVETDEGDIIPQCVAYCAWQQ